MNINKLFKFLMIRPACSGRSGALCYDVIHRDSDHTVMGVARMRGNYWQAYRNGKTFNADTRAAAVRGLVNRDLPLLVRYGPVNGVAAAYGSMDSRVHRSDSFSR